VVSHPIPHGVEVLATMLGVEVHKRADFVNPPLAKDAGVEGAHQLLAEDVYAMTCSGKKML